MGLLGMGGARYDPCDDIRRHIGILFKEALELLGGIGFSEEVDEIDEALWNEAVSEIQQIIARETADGPLLNYLGRVYFIVASLRDSVRGQIERRHKRKEWLEMIEECGRYGIFDRQKMNRVHTFLQALKIAKQNTAVVKDLNSENTQNLESDGKKRDGERGG